MGSGSFDPGAYASYTRSTAHKKRDEVFASRNLDPLLDPKGVKIRESRDSTDSPESTPIIVAVDVTGSMGMLAEAIARKGLGTLFTEILEHKPVTNPHLMFMAIGDVRCDSAPLQVSQFEADNRIVDQLTKIWLEGGGGGNDTESYDLPWYFAARHTEHDALIKRGRRGYLFTIGDESVPAGLTKDHISKFIGDSIESDLNPKALLAEAQRKYDCYHIIAEEGDYCRGNLANVRRDWSALMGQHVIGMGNHQKLAETIVSAIEMVEGQHKPRFGASVHASVKHLPKGRTPRLAITN